LLIQYKVETQLTSITEEAEGTTDQIKTVKKFLATESTNPDSGYEPSKSSSDDEEEIVESGEEEVVESGEEEVVESREEEVVESGEDSFVESLRIEQKARASQGTLEKATKLKKRNVKQGKARSRKYESESKSESKSESEDDPMTRRKSISAWIMLSTY
jgi:hypothetical protein